MFQTGEREQSCLLSRINQQIEVAFLGVGAGQNRPENARMHEPVVADKLAQFDAMGGKSLRGFHARMISV